MINLVEVAVVIEHYADYHTHTSEIGMVDHSKCSSECLHSSNIKVDKMCDGHFFNFMPQVEFSNEIYSYTVNNIPTDSELFSLVKQYSSNYKHLLTSRGPPVIS